MVALLPNPAPPQVHAVAIVISNLFRDAPPGPADPRSHGVSPAWLEPVGLRSAVWYRRLAEGEPASCHAGGSREAVHLPAAGYQPCTYTWYKVFSDLALSPLPAVRVLGLPAPHPPRAARLSECLFFFGVFLSMLARAPGP